MKISIYSIVFKNRSIEEAINLAARFGYDGIELWGNEPHISAITSINRVKEIRSMLDYNGLEVPVIGSSIGCFSTFSDKECIKSLEELAKYLDLMDILNCNIIRVGCGGPNVFTAQKYHFEKAVYWIQKAADLAEHYNKKIAMEIRNGSLIETIESAYDFIGMVNRSNAGFIHDAGNMFITDTDYGSKSVKILKDKIFHVHVKDLQRINDDSLPGAFRERTIYGSEIFQRKLLDEGTIDYVPIFKELINIGYRGFLSSECIADVSDEQRLAHEIDEIRKQIRIAKENDE